MSTFIESTRSEVLSGLAEGAPANALLEHICLAFEAHVPATKAGVTILDRDLRRFESAVFPSLSPGYAEALRGIEVAARPGSCALAVSEGRTVVSTNVVGDTRFAEAWKDLCLKHGLEALVSIPVRRPDKATVGTFVVAYPPTAGLSREELKTADGFADLCALVMGGGNDRQTISVPDRAQADASES